MSYRTVTDGERGYEYGRWTTFEKAQKQADNLNKKSLSLTWVEDEQSNRV